ncbi:MAG: hypothetical protein V4773_16240 [Verrucomicrobiota bacterium]
MPSAETENHIRLKTLALAWAQANGFAIAGLEVRVPKSGYRADVAAYARGGGWGSRSEVPRTAVFECKQSRADLLKDAHAEAETRARLAELIERRKCLEEMLAVHRPDLRRGEALWPEYDAWDFSSLEHQAYRGVLDELETIQRRVLRGTKFAKMFRYRCADFLYLVVEDNIFAEAEVPAGWGLLVRRVTEAGEELRVARVPAALESSAAQRAALLESIAAAGTRATNRAAGVVLAPPAWAEAKTDEERIEEMRDAG